MSWSRTLKVRQMLRAQIEAGEPICLLFSDLRGFSTYTADKGDRAAFRVAQVHEEILRERIAESGIVVKSLGDGIMAAFEKPVDAIRAAVSIQQAIRERNRTTPDVPMDVGIGISIGTPVMTDIDFIGHSVNVAQRLSAAAKGGQILVTEEISARVSLPTALRYVRTGQRDLRGVGVERLVEVAWMGEVARVSDANDQLTLILTERGTIVIEVARDTKKELRDALDRLGSARAAEEGAVSALLQRVLAAVARRVVGPPPSASDFAREQAVDRLRLAYRRGGIHVRAPSASVLLRGVDRADAERFLEEVERARRAAA